MLRGVPRRLAAKTSAASTSSASPKTATTERPVSSTLSPRELRNRALSSRLAESLRPVNLGGAPAVPVRGGAAQQPATGQGRASAGSKKTTAPLTAAAVIQHFAFRSERPDDVASRITRLASCTFATGFADRSLSKGVSTMPKKFSSSFVAAIEAGWSARSGEATPVGTRGAQPKDAMSPDQGHAAVAQLMQHIGDVAESTLTNGITWVIARTVSSPAEESTHELRLEVLNTPLHVTPLSMGAFPILAVDMTPEAYLALPSPSGGLTDHASTVPPSWSRAARNKSVKYSAVIAPAALVCPSRVAPTEQRAMHVSRCVASLDWEFAAQQFGMAEAWYNGAARAKSRAARKAALHDASERAARQKLTATTVAADVDEATEPAEQSSKPSESKPTASEQPSITNAAETVAANEKKEAEPEKPPTTPAADFELPEPVAEPSGVEPAVDDPAGYWAALQQLPSTETVVGEPQQCSDGSTLYTLANGAQRFVREDQTTVVVRPSGAQEEYTAESELKMVVLPDGTQVWPNHGGSGDLKQTIILPDGTTTYQYHNGSSITQLPGGDIKTVYSDGTEELTKAEGSPSA